MQAQMLAPAAVLVAWSLIVLFWMAGTRLPALKSMGGIGAAKPGGRGQDLNGVLPDQVNWKAHNFAHLMESPTMFYALVVIIAMMGAAAIDVTFAWVYVALRIIHSVYQATINKVPVRFFIFLLSTLALVFLAYRAVALTVFADMATLPD